MKDLSVQERDEPLLHNSTDTDLIEEIIFDDRTIVRQRIESEPGQRRKSERDGVRLSLDEIPVPILLIEKSTGTIFAVNTALNDRYGITPYLPEKSNLCDWLFSQLETKEHPSTFSALINLSELRYLRTPDGSMRDVRCEIKDAPDTPETHLLVYLEDNTEKRVSERNLRKSKRRLCNILDSMQHGYLSLDREGVLTFANREAQRLLGQDHSSLIGQPLQNVEAFSSLPELIAASQTAMLKQTTFDLLCVLPSGVEPSALWRIRGFPSQDGVSLYIDDRSEIESLQQRLKTGDSFLQSTLEGTIHALSYAIALRDPYTAGHQRRVSKLVTEMAKVRGCPPEEIERYRKAALLHDIGKISLPAEILSRPGHLSPAEMSIIQTHSRTGYEMLRGIELEPIIAIVALQHHERLDGSGYPQGLVGDEISPEAQMMAVADVVEAMASHRPFRPSLGIEIALNEVINNRGTRYNSEAVEACLAVLESNGFDLEHLMKQEPHYAG